MTLNCVVTSAPITSRDSRASFILLALTPLRPYVLDTGNEMVTLVEMQIGGENEFPSEFWFTSVEQSTAVSAPESSVRKILLLQFVCGAVEPPHELRKPLTLPFTSESNFS